jgi:uncharacterized protein
VIVHRPSEKVLVDGPVGSIQMLIDEPAERRGLALVAHPHPLFGGTNQNKVVYTLAHTLRDLGYVALRPNFRGVDKSAGQHDHGQGETQDLLAILRYAAERFGDAEVVLAGFSFGAFVQTRVAKHLAECGRAAKRLILVGLATGPGNNVPYVAEPVPSDSILIHGNRDEVVPIDNVFAFAEALGLPVTVIPGADHFFHGRLPMIRAVVEQAWR